MAKKIAKIDAEAMNSLYASELTRAGVKFAADDSNGAPLAPQALKDHAEYLEIIKSVLAEDGRSDFAENDVLTD
jgi:hypothetical protein